MVDRITISGSRGDDTILIFLPPEHIGGFDIFGSSGHDNIVGNNFDDYLYGGRGIDALSGQDGGDFLSGGRGRDALYGGAGDDYLDGGKGRDQFFGGEGADTFVVSGKDKIHDFNPGEGDLIL